MASQLILDRTDDAIDRLVTSWKNGGVYDVRMRIEQLTSGPPLATFHVAEIQSNEPDAATPETDSHAEAGEDADETAPPAASKPTVQVKY